MRKIIKRQYFPDRIGAAKSCHMIADTIQELHAFAATIQVKKFHKGKILQNRLERARAIINGAREITSREIIEQERNKRVLEK